MLTNSAGFTPSYPAPRQPVLRQIAIALGDGFEHIRLARIHFYDHPLRRSVGSLGDGRKILKPLPDQTSPE